MSGEEEIIEVTIDMGELKKMKVPELKKKVAELGLPTKGTKAELLARVEKYLHEQEEEEELLEDEVEEEEEEEVEEEDGGGGGEGQGQQEKAESQPINSEPAVDTANSANLEDKKAESSSVEESGSTEIKKKRTISTSSLSSCQADRLAQRAAKFGGNTSEEAKKIARAERFGTALENNYQGLGKRPTPTGDELEKLKKRAARFGSSVSPAITVVEEDEKKKKRMERFGLTAPDMSVEERKKLRAAKFGIS